MVAPAYATARSNLAKSMGLGRRGQGEEASQSGLNGAVQPEAKAAKAKRGVAAKGARK
jgi:hypothetical protein